MKKTERYFYPAVFTIEPGQEIAVVFPDLNCATSGVNEEDALLSARELLGCVIAGLEEDGEAIPAPTPLSEIDTANNQYSSLIDVYMPSIRMARVNRSVLNDTPKMVHHSTSQRGIKTNESKLFMKYFDLVQREASSLDAVFFLDCGEGREFFLNELEGEDMSGWLIPKRVADDFEADWQDDDVDEKWNDYVVFAIWNLVNDTLKVEFVRY